MWGNNVVFSGRDWWVSFICALRLVKNCNFHRILIQPLTWRCSASFNCGRSRRMQNINSLRTVRTTLIQSVLCVVGVKSIICTVKYFHSYYSDFHLFTLINVAGIYPLVSFSTTAVEKQWRWRRTYDHLHMLTFIGTKSTWGNKHINAKRSTYYIVHKEYNVEHERWTRNYKHYKFTERTLLYYSWQLS
jgi:hypothetical protein